MTYAMLRRLSGGILFACLFSNSNVVCAQGFIAGDLAVVVVGDGSAALSAAANKVFLKEFKATGNSGAINSISLPNGATGAPSNGNRYLTMSGSAASEGQLSMVGNRLVLTGYNANNGTASVASSTSTAANRVIGVVDWTSGAIDTSTTLTTAYSGGNIRGATLIDDTAYTVGSSGGQYSIALGTTGIGSVYSTTQGNARHIENYGGQLYVSSGASPNYGISTYSGPSNTAVPLFSEVSTTSPYDFAFADASTVYLTDERNAGSGGIQKWVKSGNTWSLSYTLAVGSNAGARAVTVAKDDLGNNVLWATTSEASANRLIRITDMGDAATSLPTLSVQATASTNTIFRGVRRLGDTTFSSSPAVPSPSALLPFLMGAPVLAVRLRRRK